MNWKKLKIYCSPEAIEILSAVLLDNGITGFIINDPLITNELYNEKHSHWAYIDEGLKNHKTIDSSIEVYFPEDEQGSENLINVQAAIELLKNQNFDFGLGSLEFEHDEADDKIWLNDWKKYFKPIKIGKTFYIKPSWEIITVKHNRKVIEMDPANSFGSGTHATTQLCLTAFEKIYDNKENIDVLDLGCGSGILGIGAALSGVQHVTFADIDLHCTQTARENAINNNLAIDNLGFVCGNILSDSTLFEKIGINKYDIVFANIMAEILIEMAPVLEKFLKEKGYIILSGIITQRLEAVKHAFIEEDYDIISTDTKDDWCAVVVRK